MKFKRLLSIISCAALALGAAGCGGSGSSAVSGSGDKLNIVCTAFPVYDWVRELTKDSKKDIEITYLLDKGADMHSFQPTADDIMKISTCDMFVYVGGESDKWAEDALKESVNKDMKVIDLMSSLGEDAKEEVVKEGMQGEEEHDHEDEEHEDHDHSEAPEYDEHIWLSVRNAEKLCGVICDELCSIDKDNAESYKSALAGYKTELEKLDADFKALADKTSEKTLIFGDRFPFRYFVEDYGFDYYAAFVGCSAETEASFETIAFLAGKADDLSAKTVYILENSDGKIAKAIIDSTKSKSAKTAVLNSIQSVSREQLDSGESYLSLMKKNYETLSSTLS